MKTEADIIEAIRVLRYERECSFIKVFELLKGSYNKDRNYHELFDVIITEFSQFPRRPAGKEK